MTDSSVSMGVKLIYGSDFVNSRVCQVLQGNKVIKYSPYEVKEFGFKDGSVYVSREVHFADSSRRVFLSRLVKGEITLYYYRAKGIKTFFIEKDSSLFVELPRRNSAKEHYSEQLIGLTKGCQDVADACRSVQYRKRSMSKLIENYNSCEPIVFPHFKYGVFVGYEFTKLVPSKITHEYMEYFDFNYDGGYTVGGFINCPILISNFSLYSDVSYSKHGFSYNGIVSNRGVDFVVNLSSLKVPIFIRYSYLSRKYSPFVEAGLIGVANFNNELLMFETSSVDNNIIINETDESVSISKGQFGFGFGGGVEYKLNYRNTVFFAFSIENLYSNSELNPINISSFRFVTGLSF
ncbi:MAG: outer membrane beta-barrel protein [Bacteroidales bacterium]|nr:outer membrane beta-barrel protein [Bacteroidales bacterium]